MGFIDADAHVDETEETREYMDPAEARHRPVWLDAQTGEGILPKNRRSRGVWLIGGNVWLRRHRDDKITGTTVETRELMDVEGRLRHMDQLGVDVQVIYPTTFIFTVTDQQEVETAVHGAYNRWLADKTAASGGRLRWGYLPPILSMDRAVGEMEWAKDHGACAVLRKGVEYNRPASDPYFFPLYERRSCSPRSLPRSTCSRTGAWWSASASAAYRAPGRVRDAARLEGVASPSEG